MGKIAVKVFKNQRGFLDWNRTRRLGNIRLGLVSTWAKKVNASKRAKVHQKKGDRFVAVVGSRGLWGVYVGR